MADHSWKYRLVAACWAACSSRATVWSSTGSSVNPRMERRSSKVLMVGLSAGFVAGVFCEFAKVILTFWPSMPADARPCRQNHAISVIEHCLVASQHPMLSALVAAVNQSLGTTPGQAGTRAVTAADRTPKRGPGGPDHCEESHECMSGFSSRQTGSRADCDYNVGRTTWKLEVRKGRCHCGTERLPHCVR